ncbi:Na(+)-translocating NADH-quinone reductase subunit F [Winogradskyella sp. SYSU M77433]|uniref:Na(+)-translocating NADH-quinone reductase subunit F n=1 Tax=Winogradskyella sp. SYSU M77433 TaxID=3042722 RepID=UPI00247FAB16|nr:Na(+)-translocating NADH-quinone reductase subunit F [Winogradskyella sp. SYSU M77433]MDH7911462.1 Na(+)-translocating NADH-quinone reductase subunit F [Winogradskyella sp. SYSU M77433]
MKTSNRFDNAIKKLYTAFHNNTLNPEDCKQCAVGNILDHKDSWKHLTDIHGSVRLNYVGLVHQNLGRKFNGFSPLELLQIEAAFLKACGYDLGHSFCHKPEKPMTKDILFKGLSEVVSILCELDELSDVMDCSELFDFNAIKQML